MNVLSSVKELQKTLAFAQSQGARYIALCYYDHLPASVTLLLRLSNPGITALIQAGDGKPLFHPFVPSNLPILSPTAACSFEKIDAIVIVDQANFPWILRLIEQVIQRDLLVLPADPAWVVQPAIVNLTQQTAWRESVPVEYVARSGLSGHYLEFGTFWGRSFFPAYFRFRHWLKGDFYAFDSFQGLPKPKELETITTGGDFREHTYNFGLSSFMALSEMLKVDQERLKVVPGFYAKTLVGQPPSLYGLEPASVSVCVIDCDLYESTAQVLEFITPLLEPGCLIYFDDWRLCRASREVGERAAALDWMKVNPRIELVEIYQDHWQNQWFIFNN